MSTVTSSQHIGVEKPAKAFTTIFIIELWERFGFYGLQSLLVVYLIKELGFTDHMSDTLFGAFSALVYAFVSIGGYLGDKLFGTKRTLLIGAIVSTVGYSLIAYNTQGFLYVGLGAVITGNMFFKANPPSLVAKLYKPGDHRIDSAFTLYYLSINCGAFFSMIICPIAKSFFGWNVALWISAFGMAISIIVFLATKHFIKNIGSESDFQPMKFTKYLLAFVFIVLSVFVSAWLLKNLVITKWLLSISFIVILIVMGKILIKIKEKEDKIKFIVCAVLMFEALFFYVLYQQMPTSLNLFAIRNVHHSIFGIPVEGESFQALNPFWVIISGLILAKIFSSLGKKGKDFSMPIKFSFAMLLCSFGFLILPVGAKYFADANSMISGNWLVGTYFFQSTAEVLIGGLGLSMISKLVPYKEVGFMIGAWYMVSAVARFLGGYVAAWASVPKDLAGNTSLSLGIYADLFLKLGITAFVICVIMFLLAPKLKKYI